MQYVCCSYAVRVLCLCSTCVVLMQYVCCSYAVRVLFLCSTCAVHTQCVLLVRVLMYVCVRECDSADLQTRIRLRLCIVLFKSKIHSTVSRFCFTENIAL